MSRRRFATADQRDRPRQAGDYGGQALRLAKYFGTSAEFWINLRSHYELDRAEDRAGEQIASITPLRVA